jgi:hypothetical protein
MNLIAPVGSTASSGVTTAVNAVSSNEPKIDGSAI